MAAPTMTFAALRTAITKGSLSPVYLLHGEEGYFIDQLVKDFENVLPVEDRDFNMYVMYAPQVEIDAIVDACQRIPMMTERQVVIIKEFQAIKPEKQEKILAYVSNPTTTTTLVLSSRGAAIKCKKLAPAITKAGGVVFESKKIPDYQLAPYISNYIKERGLNIGQKALEMIREFIGSDLSRLYNEIDKLIDILGKGATITDEAVERHIGVSKDYNSFELVDALANRDAAKVYKIADYFQANPKSVPLVVSTMTIFNFFSDLLTCYFEKDKSEHALMELFGFRFPIQFKKFAAGMRNYNAFQVIEIIRAIRRYDAQSKGNGSRQGDQALFRELMFHILTAPGHLF